MKHVLVVAMAAGLICAGGVGAAQAQGMADEGMTNGGMTNGQVTMGAPTRAGEVYTHALNIMAANHLYDMSDLRRNGPLVTANVRWQDESATVTVNTRTGQITRD